MNYSSVSLATTEIHPSIGLRYGDIILFQFRLFRSFEDEVWKLLRADFGLDCFARVQR